MTALIALAATGCLAKPNTSPQAAGTPVALVGQSIERHTRAFTVRVRNMTCDALAIGSGIVIAPDLLITNRHVVDGALELQVDTWDGHSLTVAVAGESLIHDLALVKVNGILPVNADLAAFPPSAGDTVTAVGYPLGGELTFSMGRITDTVDGDKFGEPGGILRITSDVTHGNSGGPLIDNAGRVVGVVFAGETATGLGLAIPITSFRADVAQRSFTPVQGC